MKNKPLIDWSKFTVEERKLMNLKLLESIKWNFRKKVSTKERDVSEN